MKAIIKIALTVALVATSVRAAEPVTDSDLSAATDAASSVWRLKQLESGTAGLQGEISDCYRRLDLQALETSVAYCIALDVIATRSASIFGKNLTSDFYLPLENHRRIEKVLRLYIPAAERANFIARVRLATLASEHKTISAMSNE